MTAPDFSTRPLGRRPEDKSRAKVAIGPFLRVSSTPVYPPSDVIPEFIYPMDHNDQAGDCVVAAGDHALEVIFKLLTGSYTNWSDDFMLKAYQSQNHGFKSWADAGGPDDNGMVIAEFLDWLIKQDLILAYGKIDTSNQAELEAAIYLGLAIVTGEDLQVAQQSTNTWDYVSGSGEWGGHCTVWNGYWPPRVVTWGADYVTMTQAFITHQVSEAYFILAQPMVDHPDFRDNFDLAGFAAAISAITNGKVIVPVTPVPVPPAPEPFPPSPPPVPSPTVPVLDAALWAKVGPWTRMRHVGENHDIALDLIEWAMNWGLPIPDGPHRPEHEA
jgi:hypothetical protein